MGDNRDVGDTTFKVVERGELRRFRLAGLPELSKAGVGMEL